MLLLVGLPVMADTGIPMIALIFPVMLLPIIAVESLVISRWLTAPNAQCGLT